MILLAKDNLDLILTRFEGSLLKILVTLKDAFDPKSNASLEHAVILIRALIIERPLETLSHLFSDKKIILLMLSLLEN
jgi:hypothetical protein